MLVATQRAEWILGKSLKKFKFSAVEVKVDIDIQRAFWRTVSSSKNNILDQYLACLGMSELCGCLSCLVLGLLLRAMLALTASHRMKDNAGSSDNGRVARARPKAMQL